MFCPKCKVEVNTRAKVCPLCHGALAPGGRASTNAELPLVFPTYNRNTPLSNPILDKIYLWLAFFASIAAIVCNVVLYSGRVWSPLAIIVLYYGYFLIRSTLMDTKNFCKKLLFQVFLVTLLLCGVQLFLLPDLTVVQFVIPALHALADVIMAIYLLRMWKNPRQTLLPLLSVTILSIGPVAFLFMFGGTLWQYALICAAIGLSIALVAAIAYHKLLKRELSRFFHI